MLVGVVHAIVGDKRQVVEATHELGDGQHVFLTVGFDAFDVVFLPVHTTYFAAVDIVFWGRDVKDGSEQVQRVKVLKIAKLPEFHGVDEVGFPRLLACNLQNLGDLYAVDEHPAGNIGEVEFLAVVGAKL